MSDLVLHHLHRTLSLVHIDDQVFNEPLLSDGAGERVNRKLLQKPEGGGHLSGSVS